MSPKLFNLSGGKGRRTAGKPGRFDPSEPLHMTTRHAARNGRTNGTPSLNGSVDGDESRRGSLDDVRPITSYSLNSHHETKARRASGPSLQDATDPNRPFDLLSSGLMQAGRSKSKPISPTLHPLSPSRKRKRSSPTTPESPSDDFQAIEAPTGVILDSYEDDLIEAIPANQLSDREGSVDSDASEEQYQGGYAGVAQSTEFTPLASEAVSPASEESNIDAVTPEKQADIVMADVDAAGEPEVDEVEDLVDADDADADADADADDVDDVDDVDDQTRADGEGRPRRRFAGRRRADHPIPAIEAMLRRQLRLKSAFRNISRALKPVLTEVAQKTIEELEAHPRMHEEVFEYQGDDEYQGVQELLDDALRKRKHQLEAQSKWNKLQLHLTFEAETAARQSRCELEVEDLRQIQVDHLEHEFLTIARQAQMSVRDPGYETEDEDGDVLPKLKGMAYRFERQPTLDPKYESRSRIALETEYAVEDLQTRFEMHQMLQGQDKSTKPTRSHGFTVMNAGPRDVAIARRESLLGTRMLADAATEFERISSIPIIPNEEAIGLQMLGDLASRPSIRASTAVVAPMRFDRDMPPALMPFAPISHPLHHRPSMPYEGPPFGLSARSQPIQERFGQHLFHPSTPKYHGVTETIPREPRMLSPTFSPSRTNMLPPLAVRAIDDEHMAPPDSPPRYLRSLERFDRIPPRIEMVDPALSSAPYRLDAAIHHPPHLDPALYNSNHMDRPETESSQDMLHSSEKPDVPRHTSASQHLRKVVADVSPHLAPALPKSAQTNTPGSPRTSEVSRRDEHVPEKPVDQSVEIPKMTRSRNSSISQSATDISPEGSRAGDVQRRPKQKGGRGQHSAKSSKDRNGLPRRVWKSYRYDPKRGSPPPENGPAIHRFRLNSVDQAPQPQSFPSHPPPGQPLAVWHPGYYYPPHDPYGPPPPFAAPAPAPPPPPHPNFPYGPYPYEYNGAPFQHGHRNSFSGSAPNWPQQPGSPLYAVPQGPAATQRASPEHWSSHAPSASQSGPHTPTTSQPQSAPGSSYGQPYPGPPIAPATPDHRYAAYGTSAPTNHPPAFAQQQRQSDGGHRRRAQSDAQNSRFQHWAPRPS